MSDIEDELADTIRFTRRLGKRGFESLLSRALAAIREGKEREKSWKWLYVAMAKEMEQQKAK